MVQLTMALQRCTSPLELVWKTKQELPRRNLPLEQERCTLLQELAWQRLLALELRDELMRRSWGGIFPLAQERCPLPQERARHVLLALELRD